MAITLDAASKASQVYSMQSSNTLAVDAGSGANRLLVVFLMMRGSIQNISSVTYNSVSLSLATSQQVTGQYLKTHLYYLVAPTTGSNNLVVSYDLTQSQAVLMACVYNGVDQSSPLDQTNQAEGNSNAPSASVTPTSNNQLVIGGILHETVSALTPSLTSLWDNDHGAWVTSAEYIIQTTAAAQAVSWSAGGADVWCMAVASLKEASAGNVTVTPSVASGRALGSDPGVILGTISTTPGKAESRAAGVDPAIILSSISVTPSPASCAALGIAPSVVISGGAITPQAAICAAGVSGPGVTLGSISQTPIQATAATNVSGPDPVLASLAVIPSVASVKAASVLPGVVYGSLFISPGVAVCVSETIPPGVTLAGHSVTPSIASAVARVANPTVIDGGGVIRRINKFRSTLYGWMNRL